MGTVTRTYQKEAKEDEGDEVEVGKVAPTLTGIGVLITGLVVETRQHDLMPGLPSGTPEKKGRAMRPTKEGPGQPEKKSQKSWLKCIPSLGSLPQRTHSYVRSR